MIVSIDWLTNNPIRSDDFIIKNEIFFSDHPVKIKNKQKNEKEWIILL